METASKRRFARDGFTIVELLIVILLVSVILVFAVPSLVNLSPSRKANIAEMLAYLEKARAQAIANQRDVYVCFVDDNFPETDYRFRAMGVFKSGSLTEEGNPVDTRELEQQDRTFFLPVGLVFADKSDLEKQGRAGNEQTVLDSPKVREFPFRVGGEIVSATMPYLLFNKVGRIEVPFFSDSEAYVAISDGNTENGRKILFGNQDQDLSELIRLNYQTGAMTTIIR